MQYRHGDVMLVTTGAVPSESKKLQAGRIVLARGEVTGHAHEILTLPDAPECDLWEAENGTWYLHVPDGAEARLVHTQSGAEVACPEHDPIFLSPGTYTVIRPREYSPQEIRRVQD
jgi:hypothetical protein